MESGLGGGGGGTARQTSTSGADTTGSRGTGARRSEQEVDRLGALLDVARDASHSASGIARLTHVIRFAMTLTRRPAVSGGAVALSCRLPARTRRRDGARLRRSARRGRGDGDRALWLLRRLHGDRSRADVRPIQWLRTGLPVIGLASLLRLARARRRARRPRPTRERPLPFQMPANPRCRDPRPAAPGRHARSC